MHSSRIVRSVQDGMGCALVSLTGVLPDSRSVPCATRPFSKPFAIISPLNVTRRSQRGGWSGMTDTSSRLERRYSIRSLAARFPRGNRRSDRRRRNIGNRLLQSVELLRQGHALFEHPRSLLRGCLEHARRMLGANSHPREMLVACQKHPSSNTERARVSLGP